MNKINAHSRAFSVVLCTTEGDGFKKGCLYPMLGWNNGVHILREDEYGNSYDFECHTTDDGLGTEVYFPSSGEESPEFIDYSGFILVKEAKVDEQG